jgi:Transposase IS66 family
MSVHSTARPSAHLDGFTGTLQIGGYTGYRALAERHDVQLAFCWSHVRRRFYEFVVAGHWLPVPAQSRKFLAQAACEAKCLPPES